LSELNRVLVTGGAGFIGSHLVSRLLDEGVDTIVFDNFSTGFRSNIDRVRAARRSSELIVVEADVRDALALEEAADGCDAIVHLAALVSVQESLESPSDCYDINSTGTFHALEAARKQGVESFVLASSAAVYGDTDEVPTPEDTPLRPLTPYGATKAEGEMLCSTYAASFDVAAVPLRFFNVFGEYQDPSGPYAAVISKFAECFEAGVRPTIFGDGEQTRDFIYVGDVVRAVLSALAASADVAGHPVNVGTGSSVSLHRLVEAFGEAWGSRLTPEMAAAREGDIRHSCAVVERAREELGFVAKTSLVDGLVALRESLGESE
jgi:nucleoside-diphosphate-sugar epimerase